MANLSGFVKLHRKMIEWGWYSDSVVKDVFLHILMVATFKPSQYRGYNLVPGQAIIGLNKLSKELGFSVQQVRTALKKLESTGEISLFPTNRFTIATVENWAFYQGEDEGSNKRATNKQQTDNKRATNKQQHLKNVKRVKNVKKESVCTHAHGFFQNVFLSDDEYSAFAGKYENAAEIIESLSNYKERKGKNDDNTADYAWLESFAKTDGKRKASGNNTYLRYLNEAKAGFPPPQNTELTEEQIEELTKIAEEVTKNDKKLL